MSRKVVSYLIYAVDGVVSDPDRFVFDRFDYEMLAHLKSTIDAQDAVLLGRRMYEEWAAYLPSSRDEPFASFINEVPKYVATRTLRETTWRNSMIVRGSVAQEVARLKALPGRDIGVHGSITLVQSMLGENLIDELRLAVFPTAAGHGRRLFEEVPHPRRLDLVDAQRTTKGVMVLTYRPRTS